MASTPELTPERKERFIEDMRVRRAQLEGRIKAMEKANGVSVEDRGDQFRDRLVALRSAQKELGQVLASLERSRETGWRELSSMLRQRIQDLEASVGRAEAERGV